MLRICTKNVLEEFPDILLPPLYCELFQLKARTRENGDYSYEQETPPQDVARESTSSYQNVQRVPTPIVQPDDWQYKVEVYDALEELETRLHDATNGDRETPTRAVCEGNTGSHDVAGFNGNEQNNSGSPTSPAGNVTNPCAMLLPESDNVFSGDQIAHFDEDLDLAFASLSRGAEFESIYRDTNHHFNPMQPNENIPPIQMYTANVHSIAPLHGPSHSNHGARHESQHIVKMENSAHSPMDLSQMNDGRNGPAP